MKFNKSIAGAILLLALSVYGLSMGIYMVYNKTFYFYNFLLATLIYLNTALFASIFSGLVYNEGK